MLSLCTLSIVPVRREPKHNSEMINMLLWGEAFNVMESINNWYRIAGLYDGYEGWINSKKLFKADDTFWISYTEEKPIYLSYTTASVRINNEHFLIGIGSRLPLFDGRNFYFGDEKFQLIIDDIGLMQLAVEEKILYSAAKYHNTPYLWGGRSILGIDCSGLTQQAYMLCGYYLPRDAWQQALIGEAVNNLSEAKSGDLAFFSENGGRISHVGILSGDGFIIHASDRVRKDKIDINGIYNAELELYGQKAVLIKRYF